MRSTIGRLKKEDDKHCCDHAEDLEDENQNQRRFRGNLTAHQLKHARAEFKRNLLKNLSLDNKEWFVDFMMNNYDKITQLQQIQADMDKKMQDGSYKMNIEGVLEDAEPRFSAQYRRVLRQQYEQVNEKRNSVSVVRALIDGKVSAEQLKNRTDKVMQGIESVGTGE